jgi:sulfite exporter TauE/SafE
MTNTLLTLFFTTLSSSLLGSIHCAAMCSGLVASCTAEEPRQNIFFYHFGRLFSYLTLGLLAGVLSKKINQLSSGIGIENFSALVVGILLTLSGLALLFKNKKLVISNKVGNTFNKFTNNIFENIYNSTSSQFSRSFLVGLASGLLPCGWLYSYVALAASQGSPITGLLIMFAFWLGTVPILTVIGLAFGKTIGKLGNYQPLIASVILILMGLWSLGIYFNVLPTVMDHSHHNHQHSTSDESNNHKHHEHSHNDHGHNDHSHHEHMHH